MKLQFLIEEFLLDLENKGLSASTLKNYSHYLKVFQEFKTEITPSDITPEIIVSYKKHLAGYSKPTQNYYLIALRAFLKFLKDKGERVLDIDSINLSSQKRQTYSAINQNLIQKLLLLPSNTTNEGLRDRAILSLFATTGLLVSEVSKLNRGNINLDKALVSICKKDTRRELLFSQETKKFLMSYLATRKDGFSPLFIRFKGSLNPENNGEKMRLSERSIERMMEKYSKQLGLAKVTPQLLRYSFAAKQLSNGEEIESLQIKLGHQNTASTKAYTNIISK